MFFRSILVVVCGLLTGHSLGCARADVEMDEMVVSTLADPAQSGVQPLGSEAEDSSGSVPGTEAETPVSPDVDGAVDTSVPVEQADEEEEGAGSQDGTTAAPEDAPAEQEASGPPTAGEVAPVQTPEQVEPVESSSPADAIGDLLGQIREDAEPPEPGEDAPKAPGDLVISEYIPDPSNSLLHEWIELHNPGTETFNLLGCVLASDGEREHPIELDVMVEPGAYVLLVRHEDSAMDEELDFAYRYSTITIENEAYDTLALRCGEVEIDAIVQEEGALAADGELLVARSFSVQVDPEKLSSEHNDLLESWCRGAEPFGPDADNHGTPGRANTACGE